MSEILVVGSANLDVSVPVPHLALPGETVLGGDALWSPGGKGANQAVAAARLGRSVAFVGCLGADAAGDQLRASLGEAGVDFIGRVLPDVPSGLAMIAVSATGENSITVSPGANARLTGDDVERALAEAAPSIILAQFEVPLGSIAAVAASTAAGGGAARLVLNPAPAQASSDDLARVLDLASVVVPNQGELAMLVGAEVVSSIDDLVDQARLLGSADAVVVTLGGAGALVVEGSNVDLVPALPVEVVDTTAAGDAFCGGLADALAGGSSVIDAARWAARVAAVAVTRRGAQTSLGTRHDAMAIG